jgi:hypothetical protein
MTSTVQNNAENLTPGWIAEWVGPVGRSACFAGVQANTFLSSDPSRLVVQYLRKYEMVDLFDFQKAYGKEKVLEFLGDDTEQVGVPYQVEKLLQTDLSDLFKDPKILASFGGKKKLTEVSSLFFKFKGISLNISDQF